MRIQVLFVILFPLLLFPQILKSQLHTSGEEVASRPEALYDAFYLNFPDHNLKKITGRQYVNPYPAAIEHQFFKSLITFKGLLHTIDDTLYTSDVTYDIFRDKLLVYVPEQGAYVELEPDFINYFILYDRNSPDEYEFTRIISDRGNNGINRTGYYQILYDGERQALFRKHTKIYGESTYRGYYQVEFVKQEKLILRRDSYYFPLRFNKSLFKIYPESVRELRKYLRRSRINIRYANDNQLVQIIQYLDKMTAETNNADSEK
jgi:hypothetical protein